MESMTNTCPYCDHKLKMYWSDESFFICPECGILIRNQKFDHQDLSQLYQASWQDPYNKVDETGGTSSRHAKLYIDRLLRSLKRVDFQGCKILDFGAGRGDLAVELQTRGAKVTAVEPYGFEFLEQRGINTYRAITEIENLSSFDGIVSLNVIEHLTAPWNELAILRDYLIPGGWIFLATPNRSSLNAMMNGPKWREARRKGHLILFNSKSLEKVLRGSGYQNIRWLNWYFPYDPRPSKKIKDWLLQMAHLDGELKFLAFQADGKP